jgi:hypothetical protein
MRVYRGKKCRKKCDWNGDGVCNHHGGCVKEKKQ